MIKAEYIDHMGDDLRTVNAARVSMNKESFWVQRLMNPDIDYENLGPIETSYDEFLIGGERRAQFEPYENEPLPYDEAGNELSDFILSEKDRKLIFYLEKHGHWTPFSHCMITMRETVPIFVARQRYKHMVGFTYNEVSRRYVDEDPEFYVPDVWRKRSLSVKQGSLDEAVEEPMYFRFINTRTTSESYERYIDYAKSLYQDMLEHGVAPEQARMILPQSMLTSYYVTGSLAAWARAYKLRIDPHAQKEIRDLAVQWNDIISPKFPISWKALTNG